MDIQILGKDTWPLESLNMHQVRDHHCLPPPFSSSILVFLQLRNRTTILDVRIGITSIMSIILKSWQTKKITLAKTTYNVLHLLGLCIVLLYQVVNNNNSISDTPSWARRKNRQTKLCDFSPWHAWFEEKTKVWSGREMALLCKNLNIASSLYTLVHAENIANLTCHLCIHWH